MIPSQPTGASNWKASAIRVFGYTSLIFGLVCGAAFVLLFLGFLDHPSSDPRTLSGNLLTLLLATNFLYVGWHAIARGSIPVRPKLPLHWSDVQTVRRAAGSMNIVAALICATVLFGGSSAIAAQVSISYANWVAAVYAGKVPGLELARELHGRSIDSLVDREWLIAAVEFPASMAVAILSGMILGVIRRRPAWNVCGAVVLLFAGVFGGGLVLAYGRIYLVFLMWFPWMVAILWYAPYLMAVVIAALCLNLSRAALLGNLESKISQSHSPGWTRHFLRTTLLVGLPAGLVLGLALTVLLHHSTWMIAGVQIVCAALFGASVVYADRER